MNRWSISLIILSLVAVLGCKSTEDIPRAKKASLVEVLNQMAEKQKEYHWFAAKAKIKFEGAEMRIGGRSNIRMIKDSLLWMNFKKVSIEGSRALIRQDSFWILYRLDDVYEAGSFDELVDYYNINLSYGQLQDMMVDNLYIPSQEEVRKFETKKMHFIDYYLNGDYYQYAIDGHYNVREMLMRDSLNRSLLITFGDFDEGGFARSKSIKVALPDESISYVSLNFSDVEFDVPKKIKFEVPSHYNKLP